MLEIRGDKRDVHRDFADIYTCKFGSEMLL